MANPVKPKPGAAFKLWAREETNAFSLFPPTYEAGREDHAVKSACSFAGEEEL